MKYQELLIAYGVKACNEATRSSTSSISSRDVGSRASSVITIGSRASESTQSPSLVELPPVATSKTNQKLTTSTAKTTTTTTTTTTSTPDPGSKLRPIKLGSEESGTSEKPIPVEDDVDDEEVKVVETVTSPAGSVNGSASKDEDVFIIPEVLLDAPSEPFMEPKTPTSVVKLSGSKVNPALTIEKAVTPTKLVDLTGDGTERVSRSESPVFEKKITCRRVSIPTEPEFMKSVRASPYADPKWLANLKHSTVVDKNKNEATVKEQHAQLEALRRARETEEQDLVDQMGTKLKLSKRIKPPVEEIYVESSESEEEEEEEEEEDKDFPPLTEEMENEVNRAIVPHPPSQILSSAFKLDITRKDIRTLVGMEWLNDEIINFYMNMLVDRSEKSEGSLPKVYAFNTFFYPTLVKDGYARIKRWTRKVDVFSHDILLVPVHLQMHWCMAVIDVQKKRIDYYDSMGGNNQKCLAALKSYLVDEHQDKKKSAYDISGWSFQAVKDIPQQMNGSDCGMFACKFAEYATRRAVVNFSQNHMPYFRRRMIYEILKVNLM